MEILFTDKNYTAFIIKNHPIMKGGYANGYVSIKVNHDLYQMTDEQINTMDLINGIHKGITLSEPASHFIKRFDHKELKYMDRNDWILGFDTRHSGDSLENCSREYCIYNTLKLLAELKEFTYPDFDKSAFINDYAKLWDAHHLVRQSDGWFSLSKAQGISNVRLYSKYIIEESCEPLDEIDWLIETLLDSNKRDLVLDAMKSIKQRI